MPVKWNTNRKEMEKEQEDLLNDVFGVGWKEKARQRQKQEEPKQEAQPQPRFVRCLFLFPIQSNRGQ